jgi:hypothetical protein
MQDTTPVQAQHAEMLEVARPKGIVERPDGFEWSEEAYDDCSMMLSSILMFEEDKNGDPWAEQDYRWAGWSLGNFSLATALMWAGVQGEHGNLVPMLRRFVRISGILAPKDAGPVLAMAAWYTLCLGDTQLARQFAALAEEVQPGFYGAELLAGMADARMTPEQMYEFAKMAFGDTFRDAPNMREMPDEY